MEQFGATRYYKPVIDQDNGQLKYLPVGNTEIDLEFNHGNQSNAVDEFYDEEVISFEIDI